jgi:hypothetical protein
MEWSKTLMKPSFPLQSNTLCKARDDRCKGILSAGAKVSPPVQRYPFGRCKGILSAGAKVSPPIITPIESYKGQISFFSSKSLNRIGGQC